MWRQQPDLCFRKQLISPIRDWHRLHEDQELEEDGKAIGKQTAQRNPSGIGAGTGSLQRFPVWAAGGDLVKTELWRRRWDLFMYRGCRMTGIKDGIFACAKHFLGFIRRNGRDPCGKNDNRSRENPGGMRNRPQAAVTSLKIGSVMNAYSSYDGMPAGGSRGLLTDLLRGNEV